MSVDEKYIEVYKKTSKIIGDTVTKNDAEWITDLTVASGLLEPFQNERFESEHFASMTQAYLISIKALLEVKMKIHQGQEGLEKTELVSAIQMNDAKQEIDRYLSDGSYTEDGSTEQ